MQKIKSKFEMQSRRENSPNLTRNMCIKRARKEVVRLNQLDRRSEILLSALRECAMWMLNNDENVERWPRTMNDDENANVGEGWERRWIFRVPIRGERWEWWSVKWVCNDETSMRSQIFFSQIKLKLSI
jgi:hypothetical protein